MGEPRLAKLIFYEGSLNEFSRAWSDGQFNVR